jgi:beta-glucuronidase
LKEKRRGKVMARLFREHKIRKIEILDGAWNFATDPRGVGIDEGWYNGFDGVSTVVPSVWNIKEGLEEYEGVCWYSREFSCEGGTLRFVFGSVLTEARVWLDGEYLGSHYGGFCQFELIKPGTSKGEHRLTVRVDNSFDGKSIPQSGVDWYHYGGITRQVSLERLEGISILSARLEYTLSDSLESADCRVALTLYNANDTELSDNISVRVLDSEVNLPVTLKPGEKLEICTQIFTISGFELWSTDNPKLYSLEASSSSDDLYDRVGFRLVEVKRDGVYLNGRRTELLGVNRHEEHPDFGFAFPEALMERDIDIAARMGCNIIRGAHYPNDPLFVDMLDRRGMLFYSEIPIWGGGFSEATLADLDVLLREEEMHREMVEHYYNHPSVIIWGMHNEILTETEAGVEMSRRYYSLLKEIGGNRIVTFATNRPLKDA